MKLSSAGKIMKEQRGKQPFKPIEPVEPLKH